MTRNVTKPILLILMLTGATLSMAVAPVVSRGQKPRRPNILFAIADDWSYGHAGAYGGRYVKTPAFDRVAREGVLFTRAFTPNAKCSPSRAVILTGRNSWQLEEAANHIQFFPAKFKTWVVRSWLHLRPIPVREPGTAKLL
jgi:N-sulfoglucosamine sulfohydrolase